MPSDVIIVVVEINILRPQSVGSDELFISRRSLVLCVPRQHALQTHADAFDILYGTPPLLAQQVETNDAVGVDVRVYRDRSVLELDKGYFRGLWNRTSGKR